MTARPGQRLIAAVAIHKLKILLVRDEGLLDRRLLLALSPFALDDLATVPTLVRHLQ